MTLKRLSENSVFRTVPFEDYLRRNEEGIRRFQISDRIVPESYYEEACGDVSLPG